MSDLRDWGTATVLDEMLETPTDSGLQSTPLPNKKSPLTCHFMSYMVALLHEVRIFGGTTEIQKEIIGRGLGL
jgi:hypothetical protein